MVWKTRILPRVYPAILLRSRPSAIRFWVLIPPLLYKLTLHSLAVTATTWHEREPGDLLWNYGSHICNQVSSLVKLLFKHIWQRPNLAKTTRKSWIENKNMNVSVQRNGNIEAVKALLAHPRIDINHQVRKYFLNQLYSMTNYVLYALFLDTIYYIIFFFKFWQIVQKIHFSQNN